MDALKTGALITQARKEHKLTQTDLAQVLHVSTQAVSKWERGLNFPDIALLEPLAGLLGLTVSELLAGERDVPPREELVRDSLRVGLAQLGSRVRKWRWLAVMASSVLLAAVLVWGYCYIRDNTEWLPQSATVISPREGTELEQLAAQTTGGTSVELFDVTLADHLTKLSVQLELWTVEGLAQTWPLGEGTCYGDYARHQVLAFSQKVESWGELSVLNYGLALPPIAIWNGRVEDIPYMTRGYGVSLLKKPVTVSPEHGAVLACFTLDPTGQGRWRAPGWTGDVDAPVVEAGEAFLLLRLLCEYE